MRKELIWSKALNINCKAIECGAVIPLHTKKYISHDYFCDYELRLLMSNIPNNLIEYGPKINPFVPWDTRLEIKQISDNHTLILNNIQYNQLTCF